jgi:hypothetical protein
MRTRKKPASHWAAKKAKANELARKVYGAGAYTSARRMPCTFWRVEIVLDQRGEGRSVLHHAEQPSLGRAYGDLCAELAPMVQTRLPIAGALGALVLALLLPLAGLAACGDNERAPAPDAMLPTCAELGCADHAICGRPPSTECTCITDAGPERCEGGAP